MEAKPVWKREKEEKRGKREVNGEFWARSRKHFRKEEVEGKLAEIIDASDLRKNLLQQSTCRSGSPLRLCSKR